MRETDKILMSCTYGSAEMIIRFISHIEDLEAEIERLKKNLPAPFEAGRLPSGTDPVEDRPGSSPSI